MNTMSTIDQTGAIEAEDVLVNSLRAIKAFAPKMRKQVSETPAKPNDKEDAAYRKGYLDALAALETYIKALNA